MAEKVIDWVVFVARIQAAICSTPKTLNAQMSISGTVLIGGAVTNANTGKLSILIHNLNILAPFINIVTRGGLLVGMGG